MSYIFIVDMFSCSSGREVPFEGGGHLSKSCVFLFKDTEGGDPSSSPFAGSDPEIELQEAQLEFKTMQSRDEVDPFRWAGVSYGVVVPPKKGVYINIYIIFIYLFIYLLV